MECLSQRMECKGVPRFLLWNDSYHFSKPEPHFTFQLISNPIIISKLHNRISQTPFFYIYFGKYLLTSGSLLLFVSHKLRLQGVVCIKKAILHVVPVDKLAVVGMIETVIEPLCQPMGLAWIQQAELCIHVVSVGWVPV